MEAELKGEERGFQEKLERIRRVKSRVVKKDEEKKKHKFVNE